LENKNAVILLFAANTISGLAQGLTMFAIPWFIINTLNEPAIFGVIYFGVTFLSLIWGTYAGGLIDRFNRKNLFVYQNLTGCVILTLAALLGFYLDNTSLGVASIVFMFTIFIYNIHFPNLYAFVQEISETENYGKITSYIEIQGQVTIVFSGALAAILISDSSNFFSIEIKQWSLQQVFALDEIVVGFKYLKQRKNIFLFGTASYGVFICVLIATHYVLPNYINQILNQPVNVYAEVEILFALGAIFAGITITKVLSKTNAIVSIAVMMLLVALLFLTINVYPKLWFFYMAFFVIGLCNAGVRIMRITWIFKIIPNQMIGRSSAVFRIGAAIIRLIFIALFTLPLFTANLKLPFYVYFIYLVITALLLYKTYINLYVKKNS